MKILLTIILSLISGLLASPDVIGYTGGRLFVVMYNTHWYSHCPKCICKWEDKNCRSVSYSNNEDGTEGFLLLKHPQKTITVLTKMLGLQDAGIYTFGRVNQWDYKINLKVVNDSCCAKSERVTGHLHEDVVINCDYPKEHKEKRKYLFKLKDIEFIYSHSNSNFNKGRFSISDLNHSNKFSININKVNVEDGGVYFCGVDTGGYLFYSIATIKTIYLHITERLASVRVIGFFGGPVMMECKFSKPVYDAKFICKESYEECSEKTYSRVKNQWEKIGGFTVYNDTSRESLMVFFSNVSEGTYRCGVDTSQFTEKYIEVTMEVKEDPCCGKMITQAGYIGKSIIFSCPYPLAYRSNPKHFCKEDDNHICHDIRPLKSVGKYSLSDHNQTGLFTVSISNLTLSDAGVYWCGVETSERDIRYNSLTTKVQISIKSGAVFGNEGDVVEIRCPYSSNYKQHSKHFCKENEEECFTEQSDLLPQTELQNQMERFSLNHNLTAGIFTVTISGLTAEDAGKYWCAVKTGDILMKYLSTELKIIMKQEFRVIGYEALNVSINCTTRTIDPERNSAKFFCMGQHLSSCDLGGVNVSSERNRSGRFSLSDDVSSRVFTVTITDLRDEDSGVYWCGEESSGSAIYAKVHLQITKGFSATFIIIIIITGGVSVFLLLFGGLALIFCKMRGTKTQGHISSNGTDTANNAGVLSAAHDYEEINYTTHRSRRNASLPSTRSQDNTVCIYSTVQKPKDDGLTYATVSFQKNPDSPSGGTVTVNEDVSAAEYAMIKYHPRRK